MELQATADTSVQSRRRWRSGRSLDVTADGQQLTLDVDAGLLPMRDASHCGHVTGAGRHHGTERCAVDVKVTHRR